MLVAFSVPSQAEAVGGHVATQLLGQPNYSSSVANNGGLSAASLNTPTRVEVDEVRHRMYVCDFNNHRVLVYDLDADNRPLDSVADFVLGQPDFVTNTAGTSATKMNNPSGLLVDVATSRLFVAEYSNNRILVFNTETLATGLAAMNVIGQTDFLSSGNAVTAASFFNPEGLAADFDRRLLFAADINNNRVLIFSLDGTVNGQAATHVLGQASFTTNPSATTATGMYWPGGLAYDGLGKRLFVSELNNSRISVFDMTTVTTGAAAVNVLGQPGFTSATFAQDASGFFGLRGIDYDSRANRLYVADRFNYRVLIFDTQTIIDGEAAVDVIGQTNFTNRSAAATASSFASVSDVHFVETTGRLYASGSHRVAGFLMYQPELVTVLVDPSLTFSVASHSGTCNGVAQTAGATSTATAISLARLSASGSSVAAQDLVVSTNATSGYSVFMNYSGPLADGGGRAIANVSGTHAAPGAFTSAGPGAFGYTLSENGLPTGTANRFTNGGAQWAALSTTRNHVAFAGVGTLSLDTNCIAYRVDTTAQNFAGNYLTTVTYSAVPVF